MSAEKLPFVGPAKADDQEALIKYPRLVAPHDKHSHHVKASLNGIIEGETRAMITLEDIFKGTKEFKRAVFEKVQLELNQFGLLIYNANVKQLVDVPGHEYFTYLGQKTHQEAANNAKIDVAEAKYKGDVDAKEREGLNQQNAARVGIETKVFSLSNAARVDIETKVFSLSKQAQIAKQQELRIQADIKISENTRKAEMAEADAEREKKSALWLQDVELTKIQSKNVAAIKETERRGELEIRRAQAGLERLRAKDVVPATIQYETSVQDAQTTSPEGGRREAV